jgi:5-methyltetrahydrofolate--homocysteine methyltransferase
LCGGGFGKFLVGVVLACNGFQIVDLGVMVPCEKILEAAKKENAQLIGLSGLITPSLDEMVHVASEMERQKFTLPLLIGGATTSENHTAVKIEPGYSGVVVHIKDASRSVGVCRNLTSDEATKEQTAKDIKAKYVKVREEYGARQKAKVLLTLEDARSKGLKTDWANYTMTRPSFIGLKAFTDYDLNDLVPRINWWRNRNSKAKVCDSKGAY